MDLTYADLYMLFQHEPEAREYFETLPDKIRAQLSAQPGGVTSLSGLRDRVQALSRGEG